MEPLGNDSLGHRELPEQELDRLLQEWKAPLAPARLRKKIFPGNGPVSHWRNWWTRFWNISIRIPLPVACSLTILLAVLVWRWPPRPAAPSPGPSATPFFGAPKFQPVSELRPRIIKDPDAQ